MTGKRLQAVKRRIPGDGSPERGRFIIAVTLCALFAFAGLPITAQQQPSPASTADVRGVVADSQGKPVGRAMVRLSDGQRVAAQTLSTATGTFLFVGIHRGTYQLSAEISGLEASPVVVQIPLTGPEFFHLVVQSAPPPAAPPAMEYSDAPNFAIAGVTDWTAIGGHGSDANLRTSEVLARDTLALRSANALARESSSTDARTETRLRAALAASPGSFAANHSLGDFYLSAGRYRDSLPLLESAWRINPKDDDNTYELALACFDVGDFRQAGAHITALLGNGAHASWYRLAGDIEEQSGNPLVAVRDYQEALKMDADEQDYFALGSELLLHRAIWQAQEVFRKGVEAWPNSLRLQTGFGAALFAGALYDEAALRLCAASDLDPRATEPYLFMGKIEIAAPNPLPCVEQRLARFAAQQPTDSTANYLYAMAVLKSQEHAPNPEKIDQAEALLRKAAAADAANAHAWFELGNLASARHAYPAAIEDYRRAIDADPQLAEAYYRLGVAYDRTGDPDRAKQEFLLHDKIAKSQQEAVNEERKKIQQFRFGQSAPPATR